MTRKVGRNEPCPCGSGRKYKKCCQTSRNEEDFQYRHWRKVEADLVPDLLSYAEITRGPDAIEDAWKEFNNDDSLEYDPESPMNMVFVPWYFFNWIHKVKPNGAIDFSETTIAESFICDHDLSSDEEKLLASQIRRPFSLCEALEVKPGIGITLFDLLRRIGYEVLERSASHTIKRGDIIYCATTRLGGVSPSILTGPYALRPTAKRDVIDLRKWIIKKSSSEKITEDQLHEFEDDIRGVYLDTLKEMFGPPRLSNYDNDPLLPQKVYFDIESADKAFHALKDLAEGIPEDELRSDATLEDGLIVKAEIRWLGGTSEARKRLGGPVLLGTIKIISHRLIVNVNSTKRAKTIRQLIEERLGNDASYKTTLVEPIKPRVEKKWQWETTAAVGAQKSLSGISEAEWAQRTERTGVISLDDAPTELRLRLEEVARQHWTTWVELPVPALNNLTPREAAKTEEGRDLLESLLLYYENHIDDDTENLLRPDVPALRRELGMDDG